MHRMEAVTDVPLVGGDLALDFVNTAEGRGGPLAGDALTAAAELARWGQRVGLLEQRVPERDAGELARAIEARELLYALFAAQAQRRPVAPHLLASLGALAAEAYAAGALESVPEGGVRWSWDPSALSTVRHAAVISAVDLLAGGRSERLKQCPGDNCGWLFLDTTKRGNRRWCSMSTCGQEAKNLHRRKPTAAPAAGDAS
jgi:predicted RNA-binding Zn ribbon-like protein